MVDFQPFSVSFNRVWRSNRKIRFSRKRQNYFGKKLPEDFTITKNYMHAKVELILHLTLAASSLVLVENCF